MYQLMQAAMFHLIKFHDRSGQTIIEAMVALAAILLILAAISVATITSLNNAEFIKNQSLASKYAQQGMESMRYTRNNDPVTFFSTYAGNTYCMCANNVLGDNNCVSGSSAGTQCVKVDNFSGASLIREVKFSALGSTESQGCSSGTRVTVTVSWSSGKCSNSVRYCHKTQLISCFSNPSASGASL